MSVAQDYSASFTGIEQLLREHSQRLPQEFKDDFAMPLYDPRDSRLHGKVWSLRWVDGQIVLL